MVENENEIVEKEIIIKTNSTESEKNKNWENQRKQIEKNDSNVIKSISKNYVHNIHH